MWVRGKAIRVITQGGRRLLKRIGPLDMELGVNRDHRGILRRRPTDTQGWGTGTRLWGSEI